VKELTVKAVNGTEIRQRRSCPEALAGARRPAMPKRNGQELHAVP